MTDSAEHTAVSVNGASSDRVKSDFFNARFVCFSVCRCIRISVPLHKRRTGTCICRSRKQAGLLRISFEYSAARTPALRVHSIRAAAVCSQSSFSHTESSVCNACSKSFSLRSSMPLSAVYDACACGIKAVSSCSARAQ